MKKYFLIPMFFLCLQFIGNAQKGIKPKFTSINQVAITWGATGDALQLQSINGLAYKTFSTGLGVGLDYYWERTVPVFIDIRKNIFSKKQTPFVYADLGINMPWVKANKENTWYKSEYDQGIYYDLGLGYRVPINKKLFANMSFGYTQKKFRETRTNEIIFFDSSPYNRNNAEHYNYTLRRFSLKAGLSF